MGINPKGNTAIVQKSEVDHLLDFRGLSIHKSNRMITKNFTSYIAGCEVTLSRMITFLIFESKRNNVVEFNTHLLLKYAEYSKAVSEKFGGEKATMLSHPKSRKDFIRLVSSGILIPILPSKKLFLINPALTYHEGYYNEQSSFMMEYEAIYFTYAAGGYGKGFLNKKIVNLGREYYNKCINKNI